MGEKGMVDRGVVAYRSVRGASIGSEGRVVVNRRMYPSSIEEVE